MQHRIKRFPRYFEACDSRLHSSRKSAGSIGFTSACRRVSLSLWKSKCSSNMVAWPVTRNPMVTQKTHGCTPQVSYLTICIFLAKPSKGRLQLALRILDPGASKGSTRKDHKICPASTLSALLHGCLWWWETWLSNAAVCGCRTAILWNLLPWLEDICRVQSQIWGSIGITQPAWMLVLAPSKKPAVPWPVCKRCKSLIHWRHCRAGAIRVRHCHEGLDSCEEHKAPHL